jgi:hypothetical protein
VASNLESNPESPAERWAEGQLDLGITLRNQGLRTQGDKGTKLLAEAGTTFLRALEVFTRDKFPQRWAETQFNLGTLFREQGLRTNGAHGTKLLAQAVTTYLSALEVFTREEASQTWALTPVPSWDHVPRTGR